MGQLERYGLYVLCVVIVLILGVAIWGGSATPIEAGQSAHELDRSLAANANRAQPGAAESPPPVTGHGPAERGRSEQWQRDPFFSRAPTSPSVEAELAGVVGVEKVESTSAAVSGQQAVSPRAGKKSDKVRALRIYTIKKGDTMEKVARRILGSVRHLQTIKNLNPNVDPRRMRPGEVLKLPWVDGEQGSQPNLLADKSEWRDYVVKTGDSAYAISIAVYGTAKYAKNILQANDISDPKKMRPKTVLKIPPLQ